MCASVNFGFLFSGNQEEKNVYSIPLKIGLKPEDTPILSNTTIILSKASYAICGINVQFAFKFEAFSVQLIVNIYDCVQNGVEISTKFLFNCVKKTLFSNHIKVKESYFILVK